MGYDLLIQGGTVVTATGEVQADVGVVAGRVAALGPGLEREGAAWVVEAGGALVLPGGVDPHVHLALPAAGTRSADDFTDGSVAAARGGTTCLVDFVTPAREEPLGAAAEARLAEAAGQAVVDFGLHMSITGWHAGIEAEIAGMVARGLPTFKIYLAYKATFGVDDGTLFRTLRAAGRAGGRVLVHAVNGDVCDVLAAELAAAGRLEPRFHPWAQPREIEAEATGRAIQLARLAGQPLYVVHVSCAEALAEVERLRANGAMVAAETCPQYLSLDESLYAQPPEQAVRWVLSPPLRGAADRDALWQGLARGAIDVVASDHCPFSFAGGKDRGLADFRQVPNGLPGIEERLDLLHTFGVVAGRISRARWVELVSTGPARQMGLYPRKGAIEVGADADLVVYDPAARRTVDRQEDGTHPYASAYAGQELVGRAVHVFSRGRAVVRDGRVVAEPGWGRFVARGFC